jgi:hypothetical protein
VNTNMAEVAIAKGCLANNGKDADTVCELILQ